MTWPHKGHFDMYQSRTRFRLPLPLTLPLPGPAAPPAGSADAGQTVGNSPRLPVAVSAAETDIASQEI
ncbi:hypothetical protein VWZ88_06365 [Phaeobacter sp. JH20_36]|uniref:hypothetical protein n=2 Tax=unclassified Phaeobacter TaxID=2621772 RepID=UPI003A8BE750